VQNLQIALQHTRHVLVSSVIVLFSYLVSDVYPPSTMQVCLALLPILDESSLYLSFGLACEKRKDSTFHRQFNENESLACE